MAAGSPPQLLVAVSRYGLKDCRHDTRTYNHLSEGLTHASIGPRSAPEPTRSLLPVVVNIVNSCLQDRAHVHAHVQKLLSNHRTRCSDDVDPGHCLAEGLASQQLILERARVYYDEAVFLEKPDHQVKVCLSKPMLIHQMRMA